MLSRIADSLFWMGRYLERTEHEARFTKVNYFSALDAPDSIEKPFILDAILRMMGAQDKDIDSRSEDKVLHFIAFEEKHPNAIANTVRQARENARGARDIISTELFEKINKYYHAVNSYNQELYKQTHLYDFMQMNIDNATIVKGSIDSTLLHNEAWVMIKLGQYIERSLQILRIIQTKLEDIKALKKDDDAHSNVTYQLAILLRSLESYDMSRKFYRKPPTISNSLEFLLLNQQFPRSVSYCLRKIRDHIDEINQTKEPEKGTLYFDASRKFAEIRFSTIEEIEPKVEEKLAAYTFDIFSLAQSLEREYFKY